MAGNADDRKDHAGEIAVCVADEDASGVPVVVPESEGDSKEGEEEVESQEMGFLGRVRREAEGRGKEVEGRVYDDQ